MAYNVIILTDNNVLFEVKTLGAYRISNLFRQLGLSSLVVDNFSKIDKSDLEYILKSAIGQETLFVAYSSSFFLNLRTNEMIPSGIENFENLNILIKQLNSSIKILYGGAGSYYFLKTAKTANKNFFVDFVFHGYSESMIIDFVEKNCTKGKKAIYNKNSVGIVEMDFDKNGASYNFKNSKNVWEACDFVENNECLPIEISRGCIFKCKFCSYPLIGKSKHDTSYIRDSTVIEQEIIENYEKFKTTSYWIVDDTFNDNDEKILMLLKIRDKLKIDLNFIAYIRIDLIQKQKLLLKDLNVNGMYFGIESLNHRSAKSIGKGMHPEKIKENIYDLVNVFNNKILLGAGFIIGLPYENYETLDSWIPWIEDTNCPLDRVDLNPLFLTSTGFDTSEFLLNPSKYGYENHSGYKWKNNYWSFDECNSYATTLTKKLIENNRIKIGPFQAAGRVKYGHDFLSLKDTSLNSFLSSSYFNFRDRSANKTQEYIYKLKKLLDDKH